ncbi:autophagy protein 6, partial [Nowakowskiella sp. JEL0078]
ENVNNAILERTNRVLFPINESFVFLPKASLVSPTSNSSVGFPYSISEDQNRGSFSHRLRVTNKLFEIMSNVSEINHPLCKDCSDELTERLDKKLADSQKEKDMYEKYYKELEQEMSQLDEKSLELELKDLEIKEQQSLTVLEELKTEKELLGKEVEELTKELEELNEQGTSFWIEANALESNVYECHEEQDSLNLRFDYASRLYDKLRKTNVYNDAFRIWHDGAFGTINGFRIGRLPNQTVEWSEINAGLGQALLLLDTLANRLRFSFKTYRLHPLGSFSRIEKVDGDKASYELYIKDLYLKFGGQTFWKKGVDNALIAFLDCLQQMGDYAEQKDPKFKLPYKIVKDKIGETSIKMAFSNDEAWTKALKYTLIDLKWILAFSCNVLSGINE